MNNANNNTMTTETLLQTIKRTEPTNRVRLVNYFGCSFDMLEVHLTQLMYTKNKYNNAIVTQNNDTIIVTPTK
jgi:hypothetical protein